MIFISRFLIAVFLCLLLFACREKKDIPVSPYSISADSLISPNQMILILSDVHVVEAALQLEGKEKIESKDKTGDYYQGIFNKYHISPERYGQSLTYYRQNPENFSKMYEKVIELLENRRKKFSGVE